MYLLGYAQIEDKKKLLERFTVYQRLRTSRNVSPNDRTQLSKFLIQDVFQHSEKR